MASINTLLLSSGIYLRCLMPDMAGQAKVRVDLRRLERRTAAERRPRGTRLEIKDNRLDSRVRRQHGGRKTRE